MIKLLILCVILFACACTQVDAESPPAEDNNSVYIKMDYMSLINSTPRDYFELELGIWRRIHEERIRQGVTTAWYFYSVVPGDNTVPDLPYDYITVSVYDDYAMVFDDLSTEAIRIVYPGIDLEELYAKSDEARMFVRSDLWKMVDVVSPYTDSKPVSSWLPGVAYEPGPDQDVRLCLLRVGNILFVGISGELFTEIGLNINELSPLKSTYVITHCNGASGYLVTDDAYPEGGYEVAVTRIMSGQKKRSLII